MISHAGGRLMFRHDDQLLPLRRFESGQTLAGNEALVLVLEDGARRAALAVNRVADIVKNVMKIEQSADIDGLIGVAMLDDRAVEIVDTGWLMGSPSAEQMEYVRGSILIIGNRQFASGVLKPLLESAGHTTRLVADQAEASALFEAGLSFDLVLSEDGSVPPGLGVATLQLDREKAPAGAVNPYDRASLLRAVDGSLRRAAGEAA